MKVKVTVVTVSLIVVDFFVLFCDFFFQINFVEEGLLSPTEVPCAC